MHSFGGMYTIHFSYEFLFSVSLNFRNGNTFSYKNRLRIQQKNRSGNVFLFTSIFICQFCKKAKGCYISLWGMWLFSPLVRWLNGLVFFFFLLSEACTDSSSKELCRAGADSEKRKLPSAAIGCLGVKHIHLYSLT